MGKEKKSAGSSPQYIRFDWAMKRLLRNKANFGIIEGLLTTLLGRPIRIDHLMEPESGKERAKEKLNRVDMLCADTDGEFIIVEVQNYTDLQYFQRMLFATSTLVKEYLDEGQDYHYIHRIYSVNIVYFSLGVGQDVVYRGRTEFRGLHYNDVLELSPTQREKFKVEHVSELYPEYYLLKANDFDAVATTPLEEWLSFLKSGEIGEGYTAPGLALARHKLELYRMPAGERRRYEAHLRELDGARLNAGAERREGYLEGREEGREEALTAMRQKMEEAGLDQALIDKLVSEIGIRD